MSCQDVILQFNKRFPNVKLTLVDDVDAHDNTNPDKTKK